MHNPSLDQWIADKTLFDIDLSYHVSSSITLAFGANNIFDTRPEYHANSPPFDGQGNIFQYRGSSPFDYTGTWYYTRAVISF